jgi:hypothetical protein
MLANFIVSFLLPPNHRKLTAVNIFFNTVRGLKRGKTKAQVSVFEIKASIISIPALVELKTNGSFHNSDRDLRTLEEIVGTVIPWEKFVSKELV